MALEQSRRDILKQLGLAGIGLSIANLPEFVLPALAQGETLVPFTEFPPTSTRTRTPPTRTYDIRKIDGPFTPTRSVLHDAALRHPDGRSRRVPSEGHRPGRPRRCRCRSTI